MIFRTSWCSGFRTYDIQVFVGPHDIQMFVGPIIFRCLKDLMIFRFVGPHEIFSQTWSCVMECSRHHAIILALFTVFLDPVIQSTNTWVGLQRQSSTIISINLLKWCFWSYVELCEVIFLVFVEHCIKLCRAHIARLIYTTTRSTESVLHWLAYRACAYIPKIIHRVWAISHYPSRVRVSSIRVQVVSTHEKRILAHNSRLSEHELAETLLTPKIIQSEYEAGTWSYMKVFNRECVQLWSSWQC